MFDRFFAVTAHLSMAAVQWFKRGVAGAVGRQTFALAAAGILCAGWMLGLPMSAQAADIAYVYDELGRLISVTAPDGSNAEYHYDAVGNIISIKRNAASTLSISEITPNSGAAGTVVRIFGSGFNAIAANNTVKFNGVAATVTAATASSLTVTAPAGVTTGKIVVANANGTATSADDFTVGGVLAIDGAQVPVNLNAGQNGHYTFTGMAGQTLGLGFTNMAGAPSNGYTYFRVYKPDGTELVNTYAYGNVNGSLIIPALPVAGQYTVSVDPQGLGVVSTTLTLSSEFSSALMPITAPITFSTNRPGQNARYRFSGTAGQGYSIAFTNGTFPSSLSVTVYKDDGAYVASTNISANGSLDIPALTATGNYQIFIHPSGAVTTGAINVQLLSDASGTLTIDGAPLAVSLAAGQNGSYTFTGAAGQTLGLGVTDITATPTSGYTWFHLYKPDGTELASNGTYSTSGSLVIPALPVAGQYTVQVNPSGASAVSAKLTLSSDLSATLMPNAIASTFSATRPGQNARYRFSGTAGQRYSVAFTNGTFPSSLSVTVYKDDGAYVTNINISANGSLDIPALTATGNYQIFIHPIDAVTTGAINVQLLSDASGTLTIDGAPLAVGLAAGQNGRYTFTGAAGQTLGLGFADMTVIPSSGSTYFRVYKPDGTQLVSNYTYGNTSGSLAIPALPVAGQYTVQVDPSGTSAVSATLTLSSDLSATLTPNATASTFSTTRPGQNGRYRFSGTAGQRYAVVFTNGTFASFEVTVFKDDGTSVRSVTINSSGSFDIPAPTATGTYQIFIHPNGAATTGAINVQVLSDASGTLAIDGAPLAMSLAAGQYGSYTFTGAAGQTLGLGITDIIAAPASGYTYFRIYKPDGTELTSDGTYGTSGSFTIPVLPVAGQYTVHIDRSGTLAAVSAKLTLSTDLSATLTPNATGSTFSTTRPGQNARYRFSGTAGQRYSVAFTNGTFPSFLTVSVYKEDGAYVTSTSISASGSLDIPALTATGTYQIFIHLDNVVTTGAINVQLLSDASGTLAIDGAPLAVSLAGGQNGRYSFTGAAGQTLGLGFTDIAATPSGGYTYFRVYKPDGTQLAINYASGTSGSLSIPALPVAGQYTLQVDPPGASVVSAMLTLSSDLNATLVPNAVATTFSTARAGQNARYVFGGTAGQSYSLIFSHSTFSSVTATIYKPDGTSMSSNSISTGGTINLGAVPLTGNYQVFIEPSAASTGKLEVQLK